MSGFVFVHVFMLVKLVADPDNFVIRGLVRAPMQFYTKDNTSHM